MLKIIIYIFLNDAVEKIESFREIPESIGSFGVQVQPTSGLLCKVLFGEAAPPHPQGPTPCPFVYHFGRKGSAFTA